MNGGWEGSWSKSESESQEGSRELRPRCPLYPAGATGAILAFHPQTLNVTLEWHRDQGPVSLMSTSVTLECYCMDPLKRS